jgi:hypothetical protein
MIEQRKCFAEAKETNWVGWCNGMSERRHFPDSPVIFEIIDKENADSRTVKAESPQSFHGFLGFLAPTKASRLPSSEAFYLPDHFKSNFQPYRHLLHLASLLHATIS